jgi:hypothetical protein
METTRLSHPSPWLRRLYALAWSSPFPRATHGAVAAFAKIARGSGVAAVLAAVGLPPQAAAQTIVKELHFDAPGVLPSSDPEIVLHNTTGAPVTSLYSVSGGLLNQTTCAVDGNASWCWPNANLSGGTLDANRIASMEVRLRIQQVRGEAGAFFQLFDGARRCFVFFRAPDRVEVSTTSGEILAATLDLTQFHTYSLETVPFTDRIDLRIDGVFMSTYHVPASTLNGFNWGDGHTPAGNGADADWDYVRVLQVGPCEGIPYGMAKIDSAGCRPTMSSLGAASPTNSTSFQVRASNVINNKSGLLFYGTAPASAPFHGGLKLVANPVQRTNVQSSGGNPPPNDCSGQFTFDMNARIQSGIDPDLVVGATVYCQYWYRDPSAAGGAGLSNGLRFQICP